MWVIDDGSESKDDALEKVAEQLRIEQKAKQVAQEVADEVAALEWQIEPDGPPDSPDWVSMGQDLIHEIHASAWLMAWETMPAPPPWVRRRISSGEDGGPDLERAPWGVLLASDLPLGVDWHPSHQLRLRGVCYALRGGKSTAQHYTEVLAHFGLNVRMGDPQALYRLACRVFDERAFIHRTRSVVAKAVGVRADDPLSENLCCVAGSHALNRLLLLGEGQGSQVAAAGSSASRASGSAAAGGGESGILRRGAPCDPGLSSSRQRDTAAPGVGWTPGDIDIFVGCHGSPRTRQSVESFKVCAPPTCSSLHACLLFACSLSSRLCPLSTHSPPLLAHPPRPRSSTPSPHALLTLSACLRALCLPAGAD